MSHTEKSQAQTKNEPKNVMAFQFSESKNEIRTIFVEGEVKFVANDVAKLLGYKNSRKALSDHCRYVTNGYIPHPQSETKTLKVSVIPESDVYRLIIKSTLPKAQEFERWVMEDVLPNLRKKGFYAMNHQLKNDFIDARDVPFYHTLINDCKVRCIQIENTVWVSINDCNKAIHSSTSANQLSKRLNAKQPLAQKIWLFGNTHPAWFTNELGLQLLLAGSRKYTNQLNLPI
jgi:prophage antirepressor-like protein